MVFAFLICLLFLYSLFCSIEFSVPFISSISIYTKFLVKSLKAKRKKKKNRRKTKHSESNICVQIEFDKFVVIYFQCFHLHFFFYSKFFLYLSYLFLLLLFFFFIFLSSSFFYILCHIFVSLAIPFVEQLERKKKIMM